jgi:hypothetical protein
VGAGLGSRVDRDAKYQYDGSRGTEYGGGLWRVVRGRGSRTAFPPILSDSQSALLALLTFLWDSTIIADGAALLASGIDVV